MAFVLTKIKVSDYDSWKAMFDEDPPRARTEASSYRILRSVEDPNEVFIQVEFDDPEKANAAREKLLASGVLERVDLQAGPTVAEQADSLTY